MGVLIDIALVIAAGIASSAWFTTTTSLASDLPDSAIVALGALGIGAAALALGGVPTRARIASLGRTTTASVAAAGALAFAVAPLAVLVLRKTDAPSGSETLFFTTAAWAVIAVAVALAVRKTATLTQLAGALLALLGAAAVVANWERPSSFSPFVKFPDLEAGMLLVGLVFAAASLVLSRAAKRHGVREVFSVAGVGAAVAGVVACLLMGDIASMVPPAFAATRVLFSTLALAGFTSAWMFSLRGIGLARTSSALFVPVLVLTAAGAAETLGRAYGVNPIQFPGAVAAAVLVVCGAVSAFMFSRAPGADKGVPDLVALALAATGMLAGIVSLALPAFAATIQGTAAGREFAASWVMRGYESATGWLPLLVSLLALSAALDSAWRGWAARNRVVAASVVTVSAAMWPFLLDTPLRTLALWIPGEVLQDLGTEYAAMAMRPVSQPAAIVGLGLAVMSGAALVLGAYLWRSTIRHRAEGPA